MKIKILAAGLVAAFTFIALPAESFNVDAQRSRWERRNGSYGYASQRDRRWNNRGKKKRYYGYKNYGQYRRTQVGNRRYRYERRYYWRDGSRLSRLIRVFY